MIPKLLNRATPRRRLPGTLDPVPLKNPQRRAVPRHQAAGEVEAGSARHLYPAQLPRRVHDAHAVGGDQIGLLHRPHELGLGARLHDELGVEGHHGVRGGRRLEQPAAQPVYGRVQGHGVERQVEENQTFGQALEAHVA